MLVLVQNSGTEIYRVAVGVAAGEGRVIAVTTEYDVLAVELAVQYSYLRSCHQSPAEELHSVSVVQEYVLVGEHTDVIVERSHAKVVVPAHERNWRINAPTILLGETNETEVAPYFNFTAGGNIMLKNTLMSIQPSLQVMTDFVAWRADITARGTYEYDGKQYFGGVTYSPGVSMTLFLGLEIMNITASYGYELFTSGIGAENGSHDIFLGYQINLDIFKKEKNKHNSIRILQ